MQCRNAKEWLAAQRDGDLDSAVAVELQEHLRDCADCCAFDRQQRRIESLLSVQTPRASTGISTSSIMRAVHQQRRISQQLEDIHTQQKMRIERIRTVGAASFALGLFTLSSIPLLVLAIAIVQTDLMVRTLSVFNGFIDVVVIIIQYIQAGLALVTRDSWLLSGIAFAVVIMMGMWLRLMRPPQEA